MSDTLTRQTPVLTDARTAAIRIAHRLAHTGFLEDHDIFKAMGKDDLPSLEVLIDGRRFLVTVEAVPDRYQMAEVIHDPAVQGVLF